MFSFFLQVPGGKIFRGTTTIHLSLGDILLRIRVVDKADVAAMNIGKVGRAAVLQFLAERFFERAVHESQLFVRDSDGERIVVVGAEAAVGLRDRSGTRHQQLGLTDHHGIVIVGAQAAVGLLQMGRHIHVSDRSKRSEAVSDRRKGLVVCGDDALIDEFHVMFGELVKRSAQDDLCLGVLARLALNGQTDMRLTGRIEEREGATMGMSKVRRTRLTQEIAEIALKVTVECLELLSVFESSNHIVVVGAQAAIGLHPSDLDKTENHLTVEFGILASHHIVIVGAETAVRLGQTNEFRNGGSRLGVEAVHGVSGSTISLVIGRLDSFSDDTDVFGSGLVLHTVDNNSNIGTVGVLCAEELVGSSAEAEVGRSTAEEKGGQGEGTELHR